MNKIHKRILFGIIATALLALAETTGPKILGFYGLLILGGIGITIILERSLGESNE